MVVVLVVDQIVPCGEVPFLRFLKVLIYNGLKNPKNYEIVSSTNEEFANTFNTGDVSKILGGSFVETQ